MFTLGPHEAIIGLGSNSSNALEMLRRARSEIRRHKDFNLRVSSPIYESDALLPSEAPLDWNSPYLNAACLVEIAGTQSADEILEVLKKIEVSLGRIPAPRWAPRPIDLDLLCWGGSNVRTDSVTIPHASLMERPFALLPALDCLRFKDPISHHPWRYSRPELIPLRTRPAFATWPELVGVINLTPDSFSDGGSIRKSSDLEIQVKRLLEEGATLIDIGAESTRPGAARISWQEEVRRLNVFIDGLAELKREFYFKISLDSRNPETVAWCLGKIPLDWINVVDGLIYPQIAEIAARSACDLIVMHSIETPPRPDSVMNPNQDAVTEILKWGNQRIDALTRKGISREKIIFDPGIGFGKTAAQNFQIISRFSELNLLKVRLLIGHSRKRFLDTTGTLNAQNRDLESAIVAAQIANSGVDYLRVHAPGVHSRALQLGARL